MFGACAVHDNFVIAHVIVHDDVHERACNVHDNFTNANIFYSRWRS